MPLNKKKKTLEPLLSFYKDGFGIKLPTKIDIPLNKVTKTHLFKCIELLIKYILSKHLKR